MKKIFALIFAVCLTQLNAQSFEIFKNDFLRGLNDGKEIISFPFENSKVFLENTGIALAATGAAFLLDDQIRTFAGKNQNSLNNNIFKIDSYYGNAYSGFIAVGIYGAGFITGNEKIRIAGLNGISSLVYATIVTQVLKYSIGRYRPYNNKGSFSFSPFKFDNDNFSLPSGHTTAAFALSTAIAESFDNDYISVFSYGVATLTAAARIYHDQHWLSDTVLGAAIGYGIGKFISNNESNDSNFSFILLPDRITFALNLD